MSLPSIAQTAAAAPALPQQTAPATDAAARNARASEAVRRAAESAASDANTPTISKEDLLQAVEDVKVAISAVTNDLTFSIDDDTGRTVVKIIDRETEELIRQIPSEEVLLMAKALDKLKGILVKQEA